MRIFLPDGAPAPVIIRYAREVRADPRAALHWLRARDPTWAQPGAAEDAGGIVERLRKAMARLGDRQMLHAAG